MRRFRSAYRRTGGRLLQIHDAHGIFKIPIHELRQDLQDDQDMSIE